MLLWKGLRYHWRKRVYMSRRDWIHFLAWIAPLEDNSAYYIFQNPMSPNPCSGQVAVTELSGLL